MFCHPSFGHIAKRIDNRFSKRYPHTFVHWSMSHRSRGGSNLHTFYTYHGTWLSPKKGGNPAVCDNMDEPWGPYAKWNKPVAKTNTAWFHFYEAP